MASSKKSKSAAGGGAAKNNRRSEPIDEGPHFALAHQAPPTPLDPEECIRSGLWEVEPIYYAAHYGGESANGGGALAAGGAAAAAGDADRHMRRGRAYRHTETGDYLCFQAHDGTVYRVGDNVYLENLQPDAAYFICGIVGFKMNTKREQLNVKVSWYYRTSEIPDQVYENLVHDRVHEHKLNGGTESSCAVVREGRCRLRELFISDAQDIYPVSTIRGKCQIRHCKDVWAAAADGFCSPPADSFYYVLGYNQENDRLASIQGEIRVGPAHQARLPDYRGEAARAARAAGAAAKLLGTKSPLDHLLPSTDFKDTLVWRPGRVVDSELRVYTQAVRSMAAFTATAGATVTLSVDCAGDEAVRAAARDHTLQHAYHYLHRAAYKPASALEHMLSKPVPPAAVQRWPTDDAKKFTKGLKQWGKNFFRIRKELLSHRTTSELVEYYYLWKKTDAAQNARPRVRPRRVANNVIKRIKPPQGKGQAAKVNCVNGDANEVDSASEGELDAINELPGYVCHQCGGAVSKDWHHGGKDLTLLCTDCRIYFKKYGEMRPMDEPKHARTPPPNTYRSMGSGATNSDFAGPVHFADDHEVKYKSPVDRADLSLTVADVSSRVKSPSAASSSAFSSASGEADSGASSASAGHNDKDAAATATAAETNGKAKKRRRRKRAHRSGFDRAKKRQRRQSSPEAKQVESTDSKPPVDIKTEPAQPINPAEDVKPPMIDEKLPSISDIDAEMVPPDEPSAVADNTVMRDTDQATFSRMWFRHGVNSCARSDIAYAPKPGCKWLVAKEKLRAAQLAKEEAKRQALAANQHPPQPSATPVSTPAATPTVVTASPHMPTALASPPHLPWLATSSAAAAVCAAGLNLPKPTPVAQQMPGPSTPILSPFMSPNSINAFAPGGTYAERLRHMAEGQGGMIAEQQRLVAAVAAAEQEKKRKLQQQQQQQEQRQQQQQQEQRQQQQQQQQLQQHQQQLQQQAMQQQMAKAAQQQQQQQQQQQLSAAINAQRPSTSASTNHANPPTPSVSRQHTPLPPDPRPSDAAVQRQFQQQVEMLRMLQPQALMPPGWPALAGAVPPNAAAMAGLEQAGLHELVRQLDRMPATDPIRQQLEQVLGVTLAQQQQQQQQQHAHHQQQQAAAAAAALQAQQRHMHTHTHVHIHPGTSTSGPTLPTQMGLPPSSTAAPPVQPQMPFGAAGPNLLSLLEARWHLETSQRLLSQRQANGFLQLQEAAQINEMMRRLQHEGTASVTRPPL